MCLPDYQGVGIGNAMSAYIGAVCKGLGYDFISTTTNPAMVKARAKNKLWKMTKIPKLNSFGGNKMGIPDLKKTHAGNRMTAAFEYIGQALDPAEARKVWNL